MNEQEIWKDIPGWKGTYQISNRGRVKSIARTIKSKRYPSGQANYPERIMKLTSRTDGLYKNRIYKVVHLKKRNEQEEWIFVHKLLKELF